MRRAAATALMLFSLASTSCTQAPTPATAPSARPSNAASAAAASTAPGIAVSQPDLAYTSIDFSKSKIFFLKDNKVTAFATKSEQTLDPAVSPDGQSLVYVTIDASKKYQLVYSRLDGTNSKVLLETPDMIFTPAWSPDGKTIAFVRRAATFGLWTIPADGGNPTVLASKGPDGSADSAITPCWTADGKSILASARGNRQLAVYTIDAKSGEAKMLGPGFGPQLSPDGKSLAYIQVVNFLPHLVIAKPDMSAPRQIDAVLPVAARWSPDGKHFFYNTVGRNGKYDLWMADGDGSKPVKVDAVNNGIISSTAIMLPSALTAMKKSAASASPSLDADMKADKSPEASKSSSPLDDDMKADKSPAPKDDSDE